MVLLYPLVLAAALAFAVRRVSEGRHGWNWFLFWAVGGALFTFSFLTGFSIGLFVLPVAALVLFWVARRSGGAETFGLVEGAGWTLLVVGPWVVVGFVLSVAAAGAYAAALR